MRGLMMPVQEPEQGIFPRELKLLPGAEGQAERPY